MLASASVAHGTPEKIEQWFRAQPSFAQRTAAPAARHEQPEASVADGLRKLASLRTEGVLTDGEFAEGVCSRRDRVQAMGFLTRALVPRGVRHAAHPGRTVKRAATPKAVKQIQHAAHPVSNAIYGVERSLNTKRKAGADQEGNSTADARVQRREKRAKPASLSVPSEKLPMWNVRERWIVLDMRRAAREGDASRVDSRQRELARLRAGRGL